MSRQTKHDELINQEMNEEDLHLCHKYELILLIREGLLGFAIGVGLYIMYALADGDKIIWLHACALGFLCMGIPYGWQCVGRFLKSWVIVFNIPVIVIRFMLRATTSIFIGFIAYPIALLCALIRIQKKDSKWLIFFYIILVLFICAVALFLIGTAL